ncbi:hypothetical protein JXM83_02410 [Candidatus Woesearchaeota archaeon]|nr:hypothetical protein [Candidatus Woesearchaeota archaeon]
MNAEKLERQIGTVLLIIMSLSIIGLILERNFLGASAVFGIIILMALPYLFSKRFKVIFPAEFNIAVLLFIFAAVFLGKIHSYYTKFWWWDIILHTSSGLILGVFGFGLIYVLNNTKEFNVNLSPFFSSLFAVSFAVFVGVIWEIFEFGIDQLFNTGLQISLSNTMWDLIVDTGGAILVAISGYLYLKYKKSSFVYWIVNRIKNNN